MFGNLHLHILYACEGIRERERERERESERERERECVCVCVCANKSRMECVSHRAEKSKEFIGSKLQKNTYITLKHTVYVQ